MLAYHWTPSPNPDLDLLEAPLQEPFAAYSLAFQEDSSLVVLKLFLVTC